MKAIVQDRYGDPDVLELRDIPAPVPGPGQVLVQVRAAGVDPSVWHLMAGTPYLIRVMGFGLRAPKSPIRGNDVAGVVSAVGANVTGFQPGDEVFGTCAGAFAEYVCTGADRLAAKPARLSFEQAAAVPTSAFTALQALRDAGRVQAGQRVLVIGAAGGVGTFAVQLAVGYGAHVTGVCGPSKVDLVASLGATEVIDYTSAEIADGTRRYDLILDIAGNRPVRYLRRALAPRGTLVLVGGEGGGRWFGGMGRTVAALALSPLLRQRLRGLFAVPKAADLATIRDLVQAGTLTPVLDRTYPLRELPDAIRYLTTNHARGKVVVTG